MTNDDRAGWLAFLIASIVIALCVLALCSCVPVEVDAAVMPEEQRANGMPLDAIAYDPPAWMDGCKSAMRIYDRTNGEQWWVLEIDGQFVVLPMGDS